MQELQISELEKLILCDGCVADPFLSAEIKAKGTVGTCSYCNQVGPAIGLQELAKTIESVFEKHFNRTTNEPTSWQSMAIRDSESDYEWERDGEPVVYAIMNAAQIPEEAANDIQRLLEDKHSDFESMKMSEETEFASGSCYEEKGTDIQEWWEVWASFQKTLKSEARFFSNHAAQTLSSVFAGIESMRTEDGRPLVVDAGPGTAYDSFCRARVFESKEHLRNAVCRPDIELGGPPARLARAGRMNPRGISVFYGSNRPEVAISEVRPPVGSDVVVAQFEIIRPLRLLDLTALKQVTVRGSLFDPKFSRELERTTFLRTLSHEIVKPVMPNDEAMDYLPTQAVADFLAAGQITKLDGILFPSVQAEDDALNVVLFHKASRVARLDIPEGTKIEISDGHWDDNVWEAYYTVWENLPPKPPASEAEANDVSFANAVRLVATMSSVMDDDNREMTLRIDTSKIDVHEVKKVQFKTDALNVTRHRMEDRPSPY